MRTTSPAHLHLKTHVLIDGDFRISNSLILNESFRFITFASESQAHALIVSDIFNAAE